mmetsp:Transcript_185/g.507  ORF Transcript_185/g.507 Transcript_185/m.507 type:complete len:271 (-) Transcript_185:295-1107(-)
MLALLGSVSPCVPLEGNGAHADLLAVVLVGEGQLAGQHVEAHHAAGPEVAVLGVLPVEDLRRPMCRGADAGDEHVGGLEDARQAEVTDFDDATIRALPAEKTVVGLDIPVADAHVVHVADGAEDLQHGPGAVVLCHVAVLGPPDAVQQVPTRAQLHDQILVVLVLENVVQQHDVRVVQRRHHGHLLLGVACLRSCQGLFDGLHRPWRPGNLHAGAADLPEVPLSDDLPVDGVEVTDLAVAADTELLAGDLRGKLPLDHGHAPSNALGGSL